MDRDVRYLWVGVIVTLTIAALVGFLFWVGGSHDDRNYDFYTVNFTDPVTGLSKGSVVLYKGVEVGRVIDIRIARKRNDLIKVDIQVADQTPVQSNTAVRLGMQGITGLANVVLQTPQEAAPPPRHPEWSQYPILQGQGTQLNELFNDVPELTQRLVKIAEKVDSILKEENLAAIDATLQNVESLTRDMNGLLSQQNVANASRTIENVAVASEDMRQVLARFEKTAAEIELAAHEMTEVFKTSKETMNTFSQEGLDQVIRLSQESRKMARSIRDLADSLEKDPSQVIYQPNYKGVEVAE